MESVKEFRNEELGLSVSTLIGRGSTIWFRGKEVALALGCAKPRNAISKHVNEEYKVKRISYWLKGVPGLGLPWGATTHRMDIGTWCLLPNILIFSSKLKSAKLFQRWVFSEVLPSIRKFGQYKVLKLENEADLQKKVVAYVRRFYPDALVIAGLGSYRIPKISV